MGARVILKRFQHEQDHSERLKRYWNKEVVRCNRIEVRRIHVESKILNIFLNSQLDCCLINQSILK